MGDSVEGFGSGILKGLKKVLFTNNPKDLAKQHRNGEERYTLLKNPEDYTADKPKTKAGINIYKALKDATTCNTIVFDLDANFSIGFLLGLPY